jgi:hypothetical protein
MPSEKMFDYAQEIMSKQGLKPRIQVILTEEAEMAWVASARTVVCSGQLRTGPLHRMQ